MTDKVIIARENVPKEVREDIADTILRGMYKYFCTVAQDDDSQSHTKTDTSKCI